MSAHARPPRPAHALLEDLLAAPPAAPAVAPICITINLAAGAMLTLSLGTPPAKPE